MALTLTYPQGGMLVTGGTGRVGTGIVQQLALADVPIVFTYNSNRETAEREARKLRQAGKQVLCLPLDMRDNDSIARALETVREEFGDIHGVACGSGVTVGFNKLLDFDESYVEDFLQGDALGYFRIFKQAVPLLRARGGGSLTTCTTIATRRTLIYDGISPFSKGSVEALVRQVAFEEAEHGIRCNAVAIGWIYPLPVEVVKANLPPKPEQIESSSDRSNTLVHQLFDICKLGRPGSPEEAGNLFAFLASNQASYLTGLSIPLDGGALL